MRPIRPNFVDGCSAEIHANGHWDLVLPIGDHVRGEAVDADDALAAVTSAHDQYVLQQWAKGALAAKNQFHVPLT